MKNLLTGASVGYRVINARCKIVALKGIKHHKSPKSLAHDNVTSKDRPISFIDNLTPDAQKLFESLYGHAPDSAGAKDFLSRFGSDPNENEDARSARTKQQNDVVALFPTLKSAPGDTDLLDNSLAMAMNEVKRKEIVTRHRTHSIERAEALLNASELFQTLGFGKAKKKAITRFLGVLIELASVCAHQQGQKNATFVCIFTGVELLAACTGYQRQTLANLDTGYMAILRDLGMIDFRGHVNTVNGSNRYDGSLLCVKLRESEKAAEVTKLDFQENRKRNFQLVKDSGNTVYQLKQQLLEVHGQSLSLKKDLYEMKILATHSLLNESDLVKAVANDCPQDVDELVNAVLDMPNARYNARHDVINKLALNISVMLNDTHSYNFWCSVLWKAYKAFINAGQDFFKVIANVIKRAEIAVREGKQKGGAYAYELLSGFKMFQSFADLGL